MSHCMASRIRRLLAPGSENSPAQFTSSSAAPAAASLIAIPPLLGLRRNLHFRASSEMAAARGRPSRSADLGQGHPGTRQPLLTWIAADSHEPSSHLRLVLWPRGVPTGHFQGVLSSRLQRDLGVHRDWFAALRELDEQLPAETVWVTAQSTTAFPFLQRLAAQRPRRMVAIHRPTQESMPLGRWWRQVTSLGLPPKENVFPAWLSPQIPWPVGWLAYRHPMSGRDPGLTPHSAPSQFRGFPLEIPPLADRAVAWLADSLTILRLRKSGRLLPWVQRMLRDPPVHSPFPIQFAAGPGLVSPPVAEGLVELGAIWWRSFPALDRHSARSPQPGPLSNSMKSPQSTSPRTAPREIVSQSPSQQLGPTNVVIHSPQRPMNRNCPARSELLEEPGGDDVTWPYLTHCTRGRDGPWPGQSTEQYWDELLWDHPDADHGPLETLRRIIRSRRLIGSGQGIRGGAKVVCWTEIPFQELARFRVYRPHRVRWDFCPYGICVDRQWLVDRGARPVIYAPSSHWDDLSEGDRPFFQALSTRQAGHPTDPTHTSMDWRREREWRTLGDLALDDLPADLGFVFVPSAEEAASLRSASPWPVRY
jgi:hypothetical protein